MIYSCCERCTRKTSDSPRRICDDAERQTTLQHSALRLQVGDAGLDAALSAARLWVRSSAAWMRGFSHADTEYERTEEFKNASRRKTSKSKNKEKEELESQKRRSDILQKKARSEQQKDDQGWLGAVAAAVLLLVSAFACLCMSGNLG